MGKFKRQQQPIYTQIFNNLKFIKQVLIQIIKNWRADYKLLKLHNFNFFKFFIHAIPLISMKYHYKYNYEFAMTLKLLYYCFGRSAPFYYVSGPTGGDQYYVTEWYLIPFSTMLAQSNIIEIEKNQDLKFIFEKQVYYKLKHKIWSDYSHEFFSEEHILKIEQQKKYELDNVFRNQINKTITYEKLMEFEILVSFKDFLILYFKSFKIVQNICSSITWLQTIFYFIMIYLSFFIYLGLLGYILIFFSSYSLSKLNYEIFDFYLVLTFLWFFIGFILYVIFFIYDFCFFEFLNPWFIKERKYKIFNHYHLSQKFYNISFYSAPFIYIDIYYDHHPISEFGIIQTKNLKKNVKI
jgi:hypothetical protein